MAGESLSGRFSLTSFSLLLNYAQGTFRAHWTTAPRRLSQFRHWYQLERLVSDLAHAVVVFTVGLVVLRLLGSAAPLVLQDASDAFPEPKA